ncbi:MAG: ExeM/NucH family extracellular endonuclease [Cyanobacteria bacterium P01_D01_bin.1]
MDPLISEFQPNPAGTDPSDSTFEISGTPDTEFSGSIISIESDDDTIGSVDRAAEVSGTFDANGLLVVNVPDLENPSFTVALLSAFTGEIGNDLDADDDGIIDDIAALGTVFDAIGVSDNEGDIANLYGAGLGGTDFQFTGDEPRLIFRDASRGDLYAVNDPDGGAVFDVSGTDVTAAIFDTDPTLSSDTFGAINSTAVNNNNESPTFSIAAAEAVQAEGDSGETSFTFTVTRSGDTSSAATVDFAVTSAIADAEDFGGTLPTGTVNFAADSDSETITVTVSGDTGSEPDEPFTITLSNPSAGTIATASADGTIQNDDAIAFTPISTIQGTGESSPLTGESSPLVDSEVTVKAVVVGDYQDGAGTNGDLNGFYTQEEDADADDNAATSEGLFIFDGDMPAVDVNVGDVVEVTGTVTEFNGLTELTDVTVVIAGTDALPTAATVNFPVAAVEDLEAFEGMQITIPDTLFVTEYFNLDRFGEVVLSANGDSNASGTDGRLDQYTQFNAPDPDGFAAYQDAITKRRIVLDDGQTVQNPDTIIYGRGGNPLSSSNPLRGGDTVSGITGILSFGFDDYRIQPTDPVDFQPTNPRPSEPDPVGGSLKVVSFNVLNFFTTLDIEGNPGSGPDSSDPRGADSQAEFDRQLAKLATAIEIIDADILGLVEIENEFGGDQNGDGQYAIDTLVNTLNSRAGADIYSAVDSGRTFVDTGDPISVGAIYKNSTARLAPGTSVEILDDSDLPGLGLDFGNPVFDGPRTNRAALAVTFEEIATGEQMTVAVNHFKSKGSVSTGDGNEDSGDGAGNNNAIRLQASQALDAWLDTDPTGSGDPDYLIIGDLNAYAKEEPITFLEGEGYTNVVDSPESSYSFVFSGQYGTLDYGLANTSLISQVTGATEWHVNADEPDAIDYNLDFGRDPSLFDATTPYRNSDHDPLIIGFDLQSSDSTGTLTPSEDGQRLTLTDLDGAEAIRFSLDEIGVDNASELEIFAVGEGNVLTKVGSFSLLRQGELADGFAPSFALEVSEGEVLEFQLTENEETRTATASVTPEGVRLDFGAGTALTLTPDLDTESPNLVKPAAPGAALGEDDAVAFDFRDIAGPSTTVEFTVFREAAFESSVGLYAVDDLTGAVSVGDTTFEVGDAGYGAAALQNALDLRLATQDNSSSTFNATIGNELFGTFITVEDTGETYFSFLGANSDSNDHVKLLGNNAVGFEDLPGLGDADYNDLVVTFDVGMGAAIE